MNLEAASAKSEFITKQGVFCVHFLILEDKNFRGKYHIFCEMIAWRIW